METLQALPPDAELFVPCETIKAGAAVNTTSEFALRLIKPSKADQPASWAFAPSEGAWKGKELEAAGEARTA
ncbi:MAG: hypothetical protein KIS92_01020 [Planctomycetota bacterium]|nr:hypothetical protein [Planctomycetota bacterium]